MTRDQLHGVPAWASVHASFAALDGVQSYPPAVQVAAIAVLFTAVCDGCGLDPSEVIDQSRRRIVEAMNLDSLTQRTEARSLRAYVQGELAA